MAYTPTIWEESSTPLGPTNMNKIERGIKDAHDMLEPTALSLALLDIFHPVGMYIETSDTTFNPNTAWGGTWELEAEGLVHVSSGTNYPVSNKAKDGGEKEVTLTAAQSGRPEASVNTSSAPNHSHAIGDGTWAFSTYKGSRSSETVGPIAGSGYKISQVTESGSWSGAGTTAGNGAHAHSVSIPAANASQPHTNMMPHKNINRWHRIA